MTKTAVPLKKIQEKTLHAQSEAFGMATALRSGDGYDRWYNKKVYKYKGKSANSVLLRKMCFVNRTHNTYLDSY